MDAKTKQWLDLDEYSFHIWLQGYNSDKDLKILMKIQLLKSEHFLKKKTTYLINAVVIICIVV